VTAEPTSATAPATVTTVAATTTSSVASHLDQTRINLLLRFREDIHEVTRLLLVCRAVSHSSSPKEEAQLTISGEEGNGGTLLSGTSSTANAVNVILRVVGVIVVEHMGDVANILKSHWLAGESWTLFVTTIQLEHAKNGS
jgi:hypothetical protein